jgi:5-methylcytosine-specific restriction endonuclease McrA
LYGTVCYLCNKEIDLQAPRNCTGDNWQMGLHIDHVIDIQYGGSDTLDNVKPTHALCNVTKRSRNDEEAPTPG